MLLRILDLLELFVLFEFLAIQQLQHAVYLDEVDAALQDELIFLIFLVEFIYFSELLDEESTAFDVIVGLTVQDQDLLLRLQVHLALLIALLQQLLALLKMVLEVRNLLIQNTFLLQLFQLVAGDIEEVCLEVWAFEVVAGAGGEEEELVGHVVRADFVDLEELFVDGLVSV